MLIDTRISTNGKLYGLDFADMEWIDGIYKERFDTCSNAIVPHLQSMFESKDISHVVENFKIAAGEIEGQFGGTVFGDGDFYKWMEAAIYTGVRTKNQELLIRIEEYIVMIEKAQQPDGYISTKQIIGEKQGTASRMGDINEFEVYNFGHLFTLACIYFRLTNKKTLLNIAEKAADYLYNLYEEAEKKGEVQTAVCPSHYMGLAELYRTTQKSKYFDLLKKSIYLRDSVENGMDDNQDRIPLREHSKIIGHAVRANYLYAGVADLCIEERDEELVEVLHKVWRSLIDTKLYITGACGSLYNGASPYGNFFHHQLVHQAYGYEYHLPNITAYGETCASIGGVCWAWRMFCLEKKIEYVDILERMILNVNLAAVSMDGKKYFYENMLRRVKSLPYDLIWGQERAEYILSYCCPPNLARLIAQTSEYAYALDDEGVYTALYGANIANVHFKNKSECRIHQVTEYPYEGKIKFMFSEVSEDCSFMLHLRIPGWVKKGSLYIYNRSTQEIVEKMELDETLAGKFFPVHITNPEDLEVTLDLDMTPRLTCTHSYVEETQNQVAVERGPLVYCMEGKDVTSESLDGVFILSDVKFELEDFIIEGRKIKTLTGIFLKEKATSKTKLYQEFQELGYEEVKGRLIPYFAWDNRGLDEMRVWLPIYRKVIM